MKATAWEFKNRAIVFGAIIGVPFGLYGVDHENAASALVNRLSMTWHMDADFLARCLFALAALLLTLAALTRTWASAYLNSGIVYASEVKTASLVADGPYRYVRNPLYVANIVMAVAFGTMMSRSGCIVAVAGMITFCLRLVFREEAELQASQGGSYRAYLRAVPRLWPALRPRVPSAGHKPAWAAGFKAESWYWGFAAALAGFAMTLRVEVFFVVTAASILLFWISSAMLAKKQR